MTKVTVSELKKDVAGCLSRVQAGEVLIVANRKGPVARIEPVRRPKKKVTWDDIMGEVWALREGPGEVTPNSILEERQRRRR